MKLQKLLLVVMFLGITKVFAQDIPIAKAFYLPLNNYPVGDGCLSWSGTNSRFSGLHAADDACVPAGTDVYAAADGLVRYARANGDCESGWIYLIIIESKLSNGQNFCVVYGHTEPSVSEGQIVNVGDKIGKVTNYYCGSNHLHFGVYLGKFGEKLPNGTYPPWCAGYIPDWPGLYTNPVQFIQNQNHGISTDVLIKFFAFYIANSSIGHPTSEIHLWGDLYVQDFWQGDIWSQLVLNPINNNVYVVFNKILRFWHDNWGYRDYGAPMTNEFTVIYCGGNYGQSGIIFTVQKFITASLQRKFIGLKTLENSNVWVGRLVAGTFSINQSVLPSGWWEYEILSNGTRKRLPTVAAKNGRYEWLVDAGAHNFISVSESDGYEYNPLSHYVVEGNDQTFDPAIPPDTEPPTDPPPPPPPNNETPLLFLFTAETDFDLNYTELNIWIRNDGSGTLNWNAAFNKSWGALSLNSSSLTAGKQAEVKLSLITSNLAYGDNFGVLTVTSNGGSVQKTFRAVGTVKPPTPPPSEQQPLLWLSHSSLDFGINLNQLQVIVKNIGMGNLNWAPSSGDRNWLSVSFYIDDLPAGEQSTVTFNLKRALLNVGENTTTILFTSNGGNQTLSIRAVGQNITPPVEPPNDPDPPPVFNTNEPQNLTGVMKVEQGKLKMDGTAFGPTAYWRVIWASQSGLLKLEYDTLLSTSSALLIPSGYDHLNVAFSNQGSDWYWPTRGNTQIQGLKFHDDWFWLNEPEEIILPAAPPVLWVSTPQLVFGEQITELKFQIQNKGESDLNWSLSSQAEWLSFTPMAGINASEIKVVVQRQDLAPGNHSASLLISSNAGNGPINISLIVPEMTSGVEQGSGVAELKLATNFPNPFNHTTVISFSLARPGFASLKIFSLLGQELATLLEAEQPAGRQQISFNAATLASGSYLIVLQTANQKLVQKLAVVR